MIWILGYFYPNQNQLDYLYIYFFMKVHVGMIYYYITDITTIYIYKQWCTLRFLIGLSRFWVSTICAFYEYVVRAVTKKINVYRAL